jgi:predicted MPP superfamily phosphohydrolase
LTALVIAFLIAAAIGLTAWRDTMADPIVRRASVVLSGMPPGAEPVTVALLSDFHPAEPNMPPARLARIVSQVNGLKPDVIVLAGDFVSDPGFGLRPYPIATSIAPLGQLRARLGAYAVIGNHDYWRDGKSVRKELARQGITVLGSNARQVGPLVMGGLNHPYIGRTRLTATLATMHRLAGGQILVSHYPDPFAHLPENTGLMLAGHTHCGQIRLVGWAPVTNSDYGQRYACGVVRERGNTLIVTAGLGTSVIPVRLGSPPDLWLITVRPR